MHSPVFFAAKTLRLPVDRQNEPLDGFNLFTLGHIRKQQPDNPSAGVKLSRVAHSVRDPTGPLAERPV